MLARLSHPRVRVALGVLVAIVAALTLHALNSHAATVIPVPNPIVEVTTKSGGVTRTVPVPIGGAPIPIDVDGAAITGILTPDIDVQVNLIKLPELLNGQVLVPNIVVRRNILAITRHLKAPPVDFDAKVQLQDANNGLKTFATIHYGFSTPEGTRMPPFVQAALTGPLSGGFVDPLDAKLLVPGYSGPLDFHVNAETDSLKVDFKLGFDAMPESIFLREKPFDDGLAVYFRHQSPVNDVQLDAAATITDPQTGDRQLINANIERLPQEIVVNQHSNDGKTTFDYDSTSVLSNPDVTGSYRAEDKNGLVSVDARAKIASLPRHLRGYIQTVPAANGVGTDIDAIDFKAVDDQLQVGQDEIGSIEFAAKNYDGQPGPIAPVDLSPGQYVSASTKYLDPTHTIWRASGKVFGVRHLNYHRTGVKRDALAAQADMGNGVRPLRAVLDLDTRGAGADPAKSGLTHLDATVNPLPRVINATFDPSDGGTDPTKIHYDAPTGTDIRASALIAGAAGDGCGQSKVVCLNAAVDKVPTSMDITLPGADGTDFAIAHNAPVGQRPDVKATVDATGNLATDRTWAQIALTRLPPAMTGRVDVNSKGALRAAEFHGCTWNFSSRSCTDSQGAVGRVAFTVRNRPDRDGLPPRPDTAQNFVSLISRAPTLTGLTDKRLEATGSVDEVRNVVFRQRDDNGDGKADGTLGASVDVGTAGAAFDVALDAKGRAADPDSDPDHPTDIGPTSTSLLVHTGALPTTFSACMRQAQDGVAPPAPNTLSSDPLLADCDRTDVLRHNSLDTTPMSLQYRANATMTVRAVLDATAPDPADKDGATAIAHTTRLDTTVHDIPQSVRADLIPGHAPDATQTPPLADRVLELGYAARDAANQPASIPSIDLTGLELRRADDVCGDPRPNRLATCASATITDVPADMYASFDPDTHKGDLKFLSSVPLAGHDRPSIDPLSLDTVSPGNAPLIVTGGVDGLTPALTGRIVAADLDHKVVDGKLKDEMGELRLNACLDENGTYRCNGSAPFGDGVTKVHFNATNSRIGQGVPNPPAASGVTDHVSMVSRLDHFKAEGEVRGLREILVSRFADPQDAPDYTVIPTTRVRVGFGPDDPSAKIRAYVDMDSGESGTQIADAILQDPPKAFTACIRPTYKDGGIPSATPPAGSHVWCERQNKNQGAIQLGVELPQSGRRPDLTLKRLQIQNEIKTSVFAGKAQIDNFGDRIDVLQGHVPSDTASSNPNKCADGLTGVPALGDDEGAAVLVEGCNANGDLAEVAGRISGDFQNYLNADPTRIGAPDGAGTFPYKPLDAGMMDPLDNTANHVGADSTDPGGDNVIKASLDAASRFSAHASISHLKRVAISPDPCYTDDRVRPAADFADGQRPKYQCVRAVAAQGKPLGVAFRSIDSGGNVTAFEEGHFNQMPSGNKGLTATIATMPKSTEQDPWCATGVPQPCQPPMVSLENDRAGGQSAADTRMEGRLMLGTKAHLDMLRPVQPSDESSARLNYEQTPNEASPDHWGTAGDAASARGARVKLGTWEDGSTAMRIGVDLGVPRYLDLYKPSSWACKSKNKNDVDPGDCQDESVSADNNEGFDSSDLRFKLVGAENKHDGDGHDYLGRIALLLHPFDKAGNELVMTGSPDPDHQNGFGKSVQGAVSYLPETIDQLPTGNAALYGAQLPGHLDVLVQIRNDYNANQEILPIVDTNQNQQLYTQVDGRINKPLSMMLRLNSSLKDTRAGNTVSGVTLSALNLASSNNGATNGGDYKDPTFRVRNELDQNYQGDTLFSELHAMSAISAALAVKTFLEVLKDASKFSPFYVDPVLPDETEPQWIDVKLNADPNSNGNVTTGNAARTVDAVAGPFGPANQADIRGWKEVGGHGPNTTPGDVDLNKGDSARVTSQATARLTNFRIGAEVGVSYFGLASVGVQLADRLDLILGMTGNDTERARLVQLLTALALRDGPNGSVRIDSTGQAQLSLRLTFSLLWGLIKFHFPDINVGNVPQPVDFHNCPNVFDAYGSGFSTDQMTDAAIALGFPDWNSVGDLGDASAASIGSLMAIVTSLITPIDCLLHVFLSPSDPAVNQKAPAPRYGVDLRPVEGDPTIVDNGGNEDPNQSDPDPSSTPDVDVPAGTHTYCGALNAKELTVEGTLRVGHEGEANPHFNPQLGETEDNPQICNGSLRIGANNVTVASGGNITASGARTSTITSGSNRREGGNGGYRSNGTGGGGGRGGSNIEGDHIATKDDFGGAAEGGGATGPSDNNTSVPPGRGGGVLIIAAQENVVLQGTAQINARGIDGGNGSPEFCLNRGAGGGAGGAIEIDALRVIGSDDSAIAAVGGDGGDGPEAGGGGAGGNVTVRSITDSVGDTFADSGDGGDGNADSDDCDEEDGDDGDGGDDGYGQIYHRAAWVTLSPDNRGPVQKSQDVKLDIREIQDGGGQGYVILCRYDAAPSVDGGIASGELNPPVDASPSEAMDAADECHFVDMGDHGSDNYTKTVTEHVGDGWHGWIAMAVQLFDLPCLISINACVPQSAVPSKSPAAIGVDLSAPYITNDPSSFVSSDLPDCPNGTKCTNTSSVIVHAQFVDPMTAVKGVACSVDGGPFLGCGLGANHRVLLPDGQGEHVIDIAATDIFGNGDVNNRGPAGHVTHVARFFVDSRAPHAVSLTPDFGTDTTINGWNHVVPTLTASTADDNPSGGFETDPITVFFDANDVPCGGAAAGSASTTGSIAMACPSALSFPDLPGEHEITARARDRAGNEVEPSQKVKFKVDHESPSSTIFLTPSAADGSNGWYRTRPLLSFTAEDNPGGSDIDFSKSPSGVRVRIDGGSWGWYDPAAENRLADGTHTVCWYAVDVAGNKQSNAEPSLSGAVNPGPNQAAQCQTGIKVDATVPTVADNLTPAAPNGTNSWYTSKPTIKATGADSTSGVDKVQQQIDGGAWTTAVSTPVDEGIHEIRVRAYDSAGNVSVISQRTVQVDLSNPSVSVGSFPPAPNDQGWYRQTPRVSVQSSDGRDNAGPDGATFGVDAPPSASYVVPVDIEDGAHTFSARPRDLSGRIGATSSVAVNADRVPPTATVSDTAPKALLLTALLGNTTTFNFTVGDAATPKVKARVIVYDELGNIIRTLPVPGDADGWRANGPASITWNGRKDNNTGALPGLYYFRVQVTDQAGNTTMSTESPEFLLVLGILPL